MYNNLNQSKELIIIGGGSSISEGISKGLWEKLKNKFTLGLNFSYRFFEATAQLFVDSTFYNTNTETLKTLPLIIGQGKSIQKKLDNSLFIPCTSEYNRDLKGGIYSARLVGIYSLSLAIYLLQEGTIYLLGYDFGNIDNSKDKQLKKMTHFYQNELTHRGCGKTSWYDTKDRDKRDFGVYTSEKQCKIINVSPLSKLSVFPKISYDQFFMELTPNIYNQTELREYIKEKLNGKYKT